MKKIGLLIFFTTFILLTGCDNQENASQMPEKVLFDNMVFDFVETDEEFYIYDSDGIEIEIKLTDETMFVSYQKRADVYFIEGTDDAFTIRKNGGLIMSCTGIELTCTGTETIDFYEEVPSLYKMVYSEE
jgi:uncharacterized protein YcfL